jgi:prepilin signal peptidase PulO-like enzyme (type II secretory pathway)
MISFLILILGAATGSFISVLISRTKNKEKGILMGRSHCTKCNRNLSILELIPVISYLIQKGKCKGCKKKISKIYPALEITTALLFFLNYQLLGTSEFIFATLTTVPLMAIFFYDVLYQEIPDRFSIAAAALALLSTIMIQPENLLNHTVAALILAGFFLGQFLFSKGKWIGGGDIRIGFIMGLFLGVKLGIIALISAYLLGSLIAIYLLVKEKKQKSHAIAFAPFLIAGTYISLYYGSEIFTWYTSFLTV